MAFCIEEEVDITKFEEIEASRNESDGAGSQEREITTFNSDETDGTLLMVSKSVSSGGIKCSVKQLIAVYEFNLTPEKRIFFVNLLHIVSDLLLHSVCTFSLMLLIVVR